MSPINLCSFSLIVVVFGVARVGYHAEKDGGVGTFVYHLFDHFFETGCDEGWVVAFFGDVRVAVHVVCSGEDED